MNPRAPHRWRWRARLVHGVVGHSVLGVALAALWATAGAQAGPPAFAGCKPVSERTGEAGCWILVTRSLGTLPEAPIFWSLDAFGTQREAERAVGRNGTVVPALGRFWVLSVGGKAERPSGGEHVRQIGPLPVSPGKVYTAQFMEAILPPGVVARTHRHPGPEAFYTEAGESCLETPSGKRVGRPGMDVIVPEGEPMSLMSSGRETRRSLVLVLHPSDQPWMTMAGDWTPKGLCRN